MKLLFLIILSTSSPATDATVLKSLGLVGLEDKLQLTKVWFGFVDYGGGHRGRCSSPDFSRLKQNRWVHSFHRLSVYRRLSLPSRLNPVASQEHIKTVHTSTHFSAKIYNTGNENNIPERKIYIRFNVLAVVLQIFIYQEYIKI